MKKIILSVVILAGIVCCLLVSASPVLAHSQVQVIKMVPGAFDPQEITVDENSTIIFKNDDTVPRWPASNIHPTHDLYPEFDPKKPINPGESWAFDPKMAGDWKIHDHLLPHIRGKVTVTGEEKAQQTISFTDSVNQTIDNIKNKLAQFFSSLFSKKPKVDTSAFKSLNPDGQLKMLKALSLEKGPEAAWSYIQETFKGQSGSTGNIHDLAHLSGKLIYEKKGISGLSLCKPSFAFGCYHGLLDTAFQESLKDLALAESSCQKLGSVNSGPYGSCVHGIGHGIASFYQTKNLEDALKSCKTLPSGREFCFDGVFMEFARGAPASFYKREDPLYPCQELENKYGPMYSFSCGRNQPSVLMEKFAYDFAQVTKVCLNAESKGFKEACFDSLGFSLASSGRAEGIISGCKSIGVDVYTARCLQAAAGELIFQDTPGWQESSKVVCASSPSPYQKSCFDHLENLIRDYAKVQASKFRMPKENEDKTEYVREQMKICYEGGGRDNCYQEVAHLFSNSLGLRETLSIFAKNENYPEIYSRCHEATHYLSRDEYQKQGSIAKVYAQCDSTCHGGCYHGTLEAYLKEKQEGDGDFATGFPKTCGKREDYSSLLVFNECLHGLGHAAMFVTDMEVPDSLALCDSLGEKDPRERCYSGLFMENSSSSTSVDHPGKYTKADDPLYPCNTLDQKYQQICYRYQSSYFALIANHDWKKVADLCLSVPNEYQNDCFRTVGTNQVGFTQDTKLMKNNCEVMPTEEFKNTCVAGIISSFAYRFVGDNKRMKDFCESVSDARQEACFRQMGTSFADWAGDAEASKNLCDLVKDPTHNSWCKGV